MVIYLDLVFILNFIINSLFVYVVNIIYLEKNKAIRVFLGGLIGGLLVIGFLFNYFFYNLIKIFGGIAVCLAGFKTMKLKQMILKITSFYLLNFLSVGFVATFNINSYYLLCLGLAAIIFIYIIENSKKPLIFMNSWKYNISVSSNKKSYKLTGFLDTGNFSKCDDLPLIYLAKKYQGDFTFHKMIMVNTVGGASALACYKPKNFEIEIDGVVFSREVLIVFSDIKEVDCLLNAELVI
ncbi:MAG: sigma-E processing peptidase SpoIIGA [Bacilli bacterium]|nr:sigma-E processing peptidase SpoIIGA [Bacilli bacterium]